jgi:glyoxylase-like metal-dependent hydrolase (beta-lactamase superfamily II)
VTGKLPARDRANNKHQRKAMGEPGLPAETQFAIAAAIKFARPKPAPAIRIALRVPLKAILGRDFWRPNLSRYGATPFLPVRPAEQTRLNRTIATVVRTPGHTPRPP